MMSGDTMAMVNTFWPFLVMAGIFYFMLYRPQKKEQKRREAMLNALKKGDKIVTIGGIYGEIKTVDDTKIVIKIADNVEISIIKGAVARTLEEGK